MRLLLQLSLLLCVSASLVAGESFHLRFNADQIASISEPNAKWPWDDSNGRSGSEFNLSQVFDLDDALRTQVIGQDEAIFEVVQPIIRYAAGLNNPDRPIGVLLFIGPTGVGKTQTAKALCQELFGSESQLIRFDMAEYYSEHLIAQLIGAPPGYIGFQQGGQFTEAIRGRKNSVILLDEMEKADRRVLQFFLGIFDEGRVTSGQGDTFDCTNAIFMLTTNLESEKVYELSHKGYTAEEILKEIQPKLIQRLTPELFNRVTPVVFHALTNEALDRIIVRELELVANRVYEARSIDVLFHDTVRDYLSEQLTTNSLGARPLQRMIDKQIVAVLAYVILQSDLRAGDAIEVAVVDGELDFEVFRDYD